MKALFKWFKENKEKREEYNTLMALSDRTLKDIGLPRCSIREVVYGSQK